MSEWDPGILVNRHPICMADESVWAYEVETSEVLADEFSAVSVGVTRTIVDQYARHGLDRLVGSRTAVVRVPWDVVDRGLCGSLPRNRTVIEIVDPVVPDAKLFGALANLSKERFRIAIADATIRKSDSPLATVANIIRLDLKDLGPAGFAARLESLREHPVKFLAENVSTYGDFDFARELGVDYYQGYFFCIPNVTGKEVPLERLTTIRLLAKLQDPNFQVPELEDTISPALAHRLLRFSNSAYVGLTHKVVSIRHAARLVGMDRIRVWAALLLLSKVGEKPRELMITAVVRAKMCEAIASELGEERQAAFFTIGLFSVLDAVLDCAMSEAVAALPLSDEVRGALLEGEGVMGRVLTSVVAYERSDWKRSARAGLPWGALRDCYLASVQWTEVHARGLSI